VKSINSSAKGRRRAAARGALVDETAMLTLTAHCAFRTIEASMALLRRAIDIVRAIVTA
jgi:hypothetical protein